MFAFDLLGTPKIAFDSGHVGVAMDALAICGSVTSSMVRTRAAGTWRPGRIPANEPGRHFFAGFLQDHCRD